MGLVNMNDGSTEFIRNLRDATDVVRDKVSYDLGNYLEDFLNFPEEFELIAKYIETSLNSIAKTVEDKNPELRDAIDPDLEDLKWDIEELKCASECEPMWF